MPKVALSGTAGLVLKLKLRHRCPCPSSYADYAPFPTKFLHKVRRHPTLPRPWRVRAGKGYLILNLFSSYKIWQQLNYSRLEKLTEIYSFLPGNFRHGELGPAVWWRGGSNWRLASFGSGSSSSKSRALAVWSSGMALRESMSRLHINTAISMASLVPTTNSRLKNPLPDLLQGMCIQVDSICHNKFYFCFGYLASYHSVFILIHLCMNYIVVLYMKDQINS